MFAESPNEECVGKHEWAVRVSHSGRGETFEKLHSNM